MISGARDKFKLALANGDLDATMSAAEELNDADCWRELGALAKVQGNFQIQEMAMQRIKDFAGLELLYYMTGNDEKLKKMFKIAQVRKLKGLA